MGLQYHTEKIHIYHKKKKWNGRFSSQTSQPMTRKEATVAPPPLLPSDMRLINHLWWTRRRVDQRGRRRKQSPSGKETMNSFLSRFSFSFQNGDLILLMPTITHTRSLPLPHRAKWSVRSPPVAQCSYRPIRICIPREGLTLRWASLWAQRIFKMAARTNRSQRVETTYRPFTRREKQHLAYKASKMPHVFCIQASPPSPSLPPPQPKRQTTDN